MKNKIILTIILSAFLTIFLVSQISASNYVYAGNGMVVYPGYVLKTVCKPFMPCGVQRIDISNYNSNQNNYNNNNYNTNQYNYNNNQVRDGDVLFDEYSSPGLSHVMADQESPTYDYVKYQNQYQNYNPYQVPLVRNQGYPAIQINTKPKKYYSPPPVKHFASTYNTRNAPYSTYNQYDTTHYSSIYIQTQSSNKVYSSNQNYNNRNTNNVYNTYGSRTAIVYG